jgi:hypothetical protein
MQQGYFWSRYEINRDLNKDGTATLRVNVTDPGPLAKIGKIRVLGAVRDTEERVKEFCGLRLGQAVKLADLREAHTKLWASGRYWKQTVALAVLPDRPGEAGVQIQVVECEDVPPLSEPLTAEDEAALRVAYWLNGNWQAQCDIACDAGWKQWTMGWIASAQHGGLLRLGLGGGEELAAQVADTATTLYDLPAGIRYASDRNLLRASFEMRLQPTVDTEKGGYRSSIQFAFGVQHDKDGQAVEMALTGVPVCMLRMARDEEGTISVKDGLLTLTSPAGMRLEGKAATGRLRLVRFEDQTSRKAAVVIRFEEDLARKQLAEWDERTPKTQTLYGERLLMQGLPHVANWLGKVLEVKGVPQESMQRMRGLAALSALAGDAGAVLGSPEESPDVEKFRMPVDVRKFLGGSRSLWIAFTPLVEQVFERESWPWTLTRQMLLAYSGETTYFRDELRRMYATKAMGPVGSLVVSRTIRHMGGAATAFANRGLDRLEAKAFMADCDALLAGETFGPRVLRALCEALGNRSDKELDAMAALAPEGYRALARQGMTIIRRANPSFAEDRKAQAELWDKVLREPVTDYLKALTMPPASVAQVR